MGVVRKTLIFLVLTAGIIMLGRLAPRVLPASLKKTSVPPPNAGLTPEGLRDSTNALPAVEADTTGGRWHEKLFGPLERSYGLTSKSIKQRKGFWEVVFPKGKPIHEYALKIENLCRANGIVVEKGVELRPANRSVEYLLQSNGQHIKLRASLGNAFMAGSARLAIVFTGLDSLSETELAALEAAPWEKTLVIDPHCANPVLKKARFMNERNEVLVELPMEPSAYPFVDPGKHALFIHHSKEDVEKILAGDLDSLPKAAGFASRLGDRAIENQPLLEKLFQFTARNGLVFLDFTGSPRSLARQTAAAQSARSRTLSLFKDSLRLNEELARKAILAQKTGDAILAMRYTGTGFRNLAKALEADVIRFNEIGLELVTLSSLVSAPDTAALAHPPASAPAAPAANTAPAPAPAPAKANAKTLAKTPAKSASKIVPKIVPKPAPKTAAKPSPAKAKTGVPSKTRTDGAKAKAKPSSTVPRKPGNG
jgi:polysaccharide deacetylase 2 family uncharacterized protein YibQ